MKRIFYFLLAAFCVWLVIAIIRNDARRTAAAPLLPQLTEQPTTLPTAQPTRTEIPSPTIGYQETAIIAQQTAAEAVRVNAQITAEYEQRILEQLQLTAQSDMMVFQVQSWTATAALTTIPLTATQQTYHNTQVAQSQNIMAGQLTATAEAPTQMAAIINLRNMEKYAKIDHGARAFFMIASSVFLMVLVVWFVRNPILPKPEPDHDDQETESSDHVEIWLRDENNAAKSEHYVFPCSHEQLTELAELVMNGERTFGYNRMETSSRTFKGQREVLEKTRAILEKARLANNTHTGESVVNERGVQFFETWFETHELPEGFEIAEVEQ